MSSVPDTTEDFWAAGRYFSTLKIRPPKIHKRDMNYPLCGEDFSADHKDGVGRGFLLERTTKQWSKVDCKACLALMPPEVKKDIERELARNKIENDRKYAEAKAYNDTIERIRRATGVQAFRCKAAYKKIGDEARTIAWLSCVPGLDSRSKKP